MSRNVYNPLTEAISFVFLILSCLLIVAGIVLAFREVETPSGKYEYTVRISDEASFNEVHEKYEIVEEKDGLYTLREKEE
jgi:Ni,Fe-hydrogenase I cytochrome b subunit